MSTKLKWYASLDQEHYTVGPEDTREEVIQAARNDWGEDGFWIVEAGKTPLKLSDTIDGMNILEHAEEHSWVDYTDPDSYGPLMDRVTTEQETDLTARLRKAADEWQEANNIVIVSWAFTVQQNEEFIEGESE